MNRQLVLLLLLTFALRVPFLNQAIQGDDVYYLYGAKHAQMDPLHPKHTQYVFQGEMVDMRGHPHGPVNPWILGGLIAIFGDVREVPFHLFYALFSLMSVGAVWFLARRFCDSPGLASLLFLATVPFVINGNSLEADLPFVAFFLGAIASLVAAVDQRSIGWLCVSGVAAALSALTAYQGLVLTAILALYLWQQRRDWIPAWIATLAAPLAVIVWQLWEKSSSGSLPVTVLAGYLLRFEVLEAKIRSALALLLHLGWIVSPIALLAAFWQRVPLLLGLAAGIIAAYFNLNPLFWIPIICGTVTLAVLLQLAWQGDFLARWATLFFATALAIFFAGSARYLLPLAAPLAILVARTAAPNLLRFAFATHLALGLLLATANYQLWDGYRQFARSLAQQAATKRVWVAGEWGLRHYLEAEGALPLLKNQPIAPGDIVVSSELGGPEPITAPIAPLNLVDLSPSIPLRLISLRGASGYSSAARGFLPFEISRAPVDRVRAVKVLERQANLSYLEPKDPEALQQFISGVSADGWMGKEAYALLKTPAKYGGLKVEIYIPPDAPARRVTLRIGNEVLAEETFLKPGAYSLSVPFSTAQPSLTVTVEVDKTHRVPADQRDLGAVLLGTGFR